MKKFLTTAAAVAAMTLSATAAQADTFASTTVGTQFGQVGSFFGIPIFGQVPTGAVYSQIGGVVTNADTATPTVTNTWTINGNVTKDCSYYGGSSTSHTLNFGQIGVNTLNNTSVNNAFDMLSPATANVNSTTAGCNFNNTVTISKANGANGLVNAAAGGYDSNEFQANIPYSVAASFTATTNQTGPAAGSAQTLTAATGDATKVGNYGAWRSSLNMLITAPTPGKALVAGNYSDTLTVELKAL